MDASMIKFGIDAFMGISQGITQKAAVNAANTVNEANAWASNLVRSANNKLGAARGSLARYTQSVNNQRVLENMGSSAEAAVVNYRRARDSATSDNFEQQLSFAEQAGAQAAASALSGLTGGVADVVAGTTALRKSRIQERVNQSLRQGDWDASQQAAAIMQAGWDSLDSSEITDSLDYSKDVAAKQTYSGNLFTQIMGGQDMTNAANMTSGFFKSNSFDAFADRAGAIGSGSDGRSRTITGGR